MPGTYSTFRGDTSTTIGRYTSTVRDSLQMPFHPGRHQLSRRRLQLHHLKSFGSKLTNRLRTKDAKRATRERRQPDMQSKTPRPHGTVLTLGVLDDEQWKEMNTPRRVAHHHRVHSPNWQKKTVSPELSLHKNPFQSPPAGTARCSVLCRCQTWKEKRTCVLREHRTTQATTNTPDRPLESIASPDLLRTISKRKNDAADGT